MASKSDQEADRVRRAELSKHYPESVIAPWSRVPEDTREKWRAKAQDAH